MATYAPVQIYQRDIYNYPLPESYYELSYRPSPARNVYDSPESIPRGCVDPQQLCMSSPVEDFAFPAEQYPTCYASIVPMMTPQYVTSSHRRRSDQATYPEGGMQKQPSYTLEPHSSYRTSHTSSYPRSGLPPTPPLSPSSSMPTSAGVTSPTSPTSPTPSHSVPNVTVTAASNSTSQRHYCLHTDCLDSKTRRPTRSFSRRADLQRHNQTTHEAVVMYSCPRPNCARKDDNGFTRMDHLIEHRRGYHHENIPKRSSRGSTSSSSGRRTSRSPSTDGAPGIVRPITTFMSRSTSKAGVALSPISPVTISRQGSGSTTSSRIHKTPAKLLIAG